MIKKLKLETILLLVSFMTISFSGFAQDLPPVDDGGATTPDDGSGDGFPPAAPIDDYIVPMALLGIASGYWLIRKRKTEDMTE